MDREAKSLKSLSQENFGRQAGAYSTNALLSDEENLKTVLQLAGISERDRVLDVATGTGFLAAVLARAAGEVVATDLTLGMLMKAQGIVGDRSNASYALADAESLPFGAGVFDVVSCRVALHHFPNPGASIAEMARVCKRDGRLVIMDIVSSEDAAKSAYHNRMEKLRDASHVKEYPRSVLERMVEAGGLRIERAEACVYTWEFSRWLSIANPNEAASAEIKKMMLDSIDGNKSGLGVEFRGGELYFTYTSAIIVARK